jgi:hypothetical protein
MEDDGGFGDWEEEAPAEEAPAEAAEEAVEGEEGTQEEGTQEETQAEGEEDIPEEELEPQEPERKLFWSKWERPKSHIYDYNYGYFNNYYSGMIDQITSGKHGKPLAESWAERSMRMYSKMKDSRKIQASADEDLVRKIRSGHNEFFRHRNELSAKDTGYHRE